MTDSTDIEIGDGDQYIRFTFESEDYYTVEGRIDYLVAAVDDAVDCGTYYNDYSELTLHDPDRGALAFLWAEMMDNPQLVLHATESATQPFFDELREAIETTIGTDDDATLTTVDEIRR